MKRNNGKGLPYHEYMQSIGIKSKSKDTNNVVVLTSDIDTSDSILSINGGSEVKDIEEPNIPTPPPAIFFEKEKTFNISKKVQQQMESTFCKFNLFVKQYDKYRLPNSFRG